MYMGNKMHEPGYLMNDHHETNWKQKVLCTLNIMSF